MPPPPSGLGGQFGTFVKSDIRQSAPSIAIPPIKRLVNAALPLPMAFINFEPGMKFEAHVAIVPPKDQ